MRRRLQRFAVTMTALLCVLALAVPAFARMFARGTITVSGGSLVATTAATTFPEIVSATVTITGTWTGTLVFESTGGPDINGTTTWTALPVNPQSAQGTAPTSTTANGIFWLTNFGYHQVRVRSSGAWTGTAVVTFNSGPAIASTARAVSAVLAQAHTFTAPQTFDEGIVLPDNVPASTTNALYNDAGTLKFNGAAIGGGGFDPAMPFVTYEADAGLTNPFNLGGLTSGLLKQTVAAGVSTPAIATPGTDYMAGDATLTSLAALGTAADRIAYTTGIDTWAETPLTAAARTVLNDASVGAMVDTLGGAASGGTGGLARLVSPAFTTPNVGVASGTSLTLSGLTVDRVVVAGAAGILTGDATFTWDGSNLNVGDTPTGFMAAFELNNTAWDPLVNGAAGIFQRNDGTNRRGVAFGVVGAGKVPTIQGLQQAIGSGTLTATALDINPSGGNTNVTSLVPTFTDVTTGNVSTSAHGLAPKGDGDTAKFLNANGAYSAPAGGGAMTLLDSGSGTDVNTAATTLDSIAITGLTLADRIRVVFTASQLTQNGANGAPLIYNVTDDVGLCNMVGVPLDAGDFGMIAVDLFRDQSSDTVIMAAGTFGRGAGTNGSGTAATCRVSTTTGWTGNWTLGVRHQGQVSGGTVRWSWTAHKIAGQ